MSRIMMSSALAISAIAGTAAILLTTPASAGTGGTVVTCQDFKVWNSHPTTPALDRLMADSISAPWKYLGGDVWELYGAVRADGLGGKNVTKDRKFVASDCR